jgi:asparagine synthase (glutamine-hydrolysing)
MKVLAKLGARGYQPYERLGLWLRRELRPQVQRLLLSDRCLGRGVFDPQTVRRVVENHFGGGNHTFLIMALMIFEMGQREFIDAGGAGEAPEGDSRPLSLSLVQS